MLIKLPTQTVKNNTNAECFGKCICMNIFNITQFEAKVYGWPRVRSVFFKINTQ